MKETRLPFPIHAGGVIIVLGPAMSRFSLSRVSGAPVSDAELIADLRRVADTVSQSTVKEKQYRSLGKYAETTLINRFGSWNKALTTAGLEIHRRSAPSEELIADVRRVAADVSEATVSKEQYRQLGKHDPMTLVSRFGSWNKVLTAAGLALSKKAGIPDEILFENILRLWEHYGRQPRRSELAGHPSRISSGPYWRRFGSWTTALRCFVEYANAAETAPSVGTKTTGSIDASGGFDPALDARKPTHDDEVATVETPQPVGPSLTRRTPRDPSLRLRYKVLMNDKCSCRQCGRSPATVPGAILHIDHIVPWSKGGETVFENLQTLCDKCNLGKSNLVPDEVA
jgi:hypothetical protein